MIRLLLCGVALFACSQAFAGMHVLINEKPIEEYLDADWQKHGPNEVRKVLPSGYVISYVSGAKAIQDRIDEIEDLPELSIKNKNELESLQKTLSLPKSQFSRVAQDCNGAIGFNVNFTKNPGGVNWVDTEMTFTEFFPYRNYEKQMAVVARAGYWDTEDDDDYSYLTINQTDWFIRKPYERVQATASVGGTFRPGMYGKGYFYSRGSNSGCGHHRFYIHDPQFLRN